MLRDAGPDLLEEVPEVVGGGGEDDLVRVEGGAAAARQSDVSHVAAPKELPVLVVNSMEPQQIFMMSSTWWIFCSQPSQYMNRVTPGENLPLT